MFHEATGCHVDRLQLLKLAVIGDGASGKTSLVKHFVHGCSSVEYHQTLGIDFYLRPMTLQSAGGRHIKIQIWDIGGQNLGGKMLDKYLTGSDGILLIYDITNASSFDNLEDWLAVARSAAAVRAGSNSSRTPTIALVANKSDLEHQRSVGCEKHYRFAEVNGLSSFSVSARTGEAVNICFYHIVRDILGEEDFSLDEDSFIPHNVLTAEIDVHEDPLLRSSSSAAVSSSSSNVERAIKSSNVCDLQ